MKLLMTDRPVSAALPQDAAAVDLSALRIANCVGCFGCWTKTPGRCVIRDDAVRVYPLIARSEQVLYVSRVKYGSYAPVMKTMLERGFGEYRTIQDYPIRGRATYLHVRKRKWLDKSSNEIFSYDWDLSEFDGTRLNSDKSQS